MSTEVLFFLESSEKCPFVFGFCFRSDVEVATRIEALLGGPWCLWCLTPLEEDGYEDFCGSKACWDAWVASAGTKR